MRSLGTKESEKARILSDIYGTQNNILLQNGLADSEDEDDFRVRLSSLEEIWEEIAPGFYQYFQDNHSGLFVECLVMSARKELGINGRFYTNGLELKHRLQKKKLKEEEIPHEVTSVSKALHEWSMSYYAE